MNEPTPVDSALEQQALEQQAQWLALEARLTDEELNDQHRDGLRRLNTRALHGQRPGRGGYAPAQGNRRL